MQLRKQQTYRRAIATHVDPDHHLQRGLRQEYRLHTRRAQARRAALLPVPTPCTAATATAPLLRCLPWPKLPFEDAQDGISYTFTIVPQALGKTREDQEANLYALLDGYAEKGGHHINVNVLNRETLLDAMDHPEKYPQLTIRVSGYAVNFIKLTREQQLDVISRTFHEKF